MYKYLAISVTDTWNLALSHWHNQYPSKTQPYAIPEVTLPSTLPPKWDQTIRRLAKLPSRTSPPYSRPRFIRFNKNPIQHIQSSKTISAVRVDCLQKRYIEKGLIGPKAMCLAHGELMYIDELDADHVQSSSLILKRQLAFIDALNQCPTFAAYVLSLPKMKSFFIQTTIPGKKTYTATPEFHHLHPTSTLIEVMNNDPKLAQKIMKDPGLSKLIKTTIEPAKIQYAGSELFFALYHNDVSNIWLICKGCNGATGKHAHDAIGWFTTNPLYGPAFVQSIQPLQDSILQKTNQGEGLAVAAKKWFYSHHHQLLSRERLTNQIQVSLQTQSMSLDSIENQSNQANHDKIAQQGHDHFIHCQQMLKKLSNQALPLSIKTISNIQSSPQSPIKKRQKKTSSIQSKWIQLIIRYQQKSRL